MAGYVFNGTSWRPINGIYVFNGTSWRTVTTGWQFDAGTWKNIYTSGTFLPEIRNATGDIIENRTIGVSMVGYRGSNVAGTYAYQWQYNFNTDYETSSWSNETGTNNSGTLTGTTALTTNYTTDASDLTILDNPAFSWLFYVRFRVTKSSEVQFSQNVRIRKRQPVFSTQTTTGARYFNAASTYDSTVKNPYIGDTLTFWGSTNWTATTTLTNDTRPDYYIFTYTTASGVTVKDSRNLDSAQPRTPTNASKYVVVSGDLGSPVVAEVVAYNSASSPTSNTATTRNVDDGVLKAPTNLVIDRAGSLYPGKIVMRWDPSDGGNDNTITYTWYLYRDSTFVTQGSTTLSSTPVSIIYPSTGSVNTAGDYKFYVRAAQSGSTSVDSIFSDILTLTPPLAFTYSAANVTAADGGPGDFTINAFAESATETNGWGQTWSTSASPSASRYETTWISPTTSTFTDVGATRADTNYVSESGDHTLQVDAYQKAVQTIKLMWTKPVGTSATSYRINYQIVNSSGITTQYNPIVEDVTEYTYTVAATSLSTRFNGITAYDGASGEGVSRAATQQGASFFNNAALQVEGTTSKTRTENLTYVVPAIGGISITGNPEPLEALGFERTGTWSPASDALGWTITRSWGMTRYAAGLSDLYNRGTASTMTPTTSDVGEYALLRITAKYKDQAQVTRSTSSNEIVPGPPTYTLTDNYNGTFTVSGVTSPGGTSYVGNYTGGSISARGNATTFTSPTLSFDTKTVNIYGRLVKAFTGGSTYTIVGNRPTEKTITLVEIGAFTWTASDSTTSPTAPGTITVTVGNASMSQDWDDASNADSYFSYIDAGGSTAFRSNYRSVSNDVWSVTNGGNAYTGAVRSVNTAGKVTVSWDASNNAGSYRVFYQVAGVAGNAVTTSTTYDVSAGAVNSTGKSVSITGVSSYASSNGTGTVGRVGTSSGTTSFTVTEKVSSYTSWSATSLTYPGTPGTPTTTRSGSTFTVSWTAATNASNYNGYVSTSTTRPSTAEVTGQDSPWTYTAGGTGTYYFWVEGVNANGTGLVSGRGQGTVPVSIPDIPTGVTSTATTFVSPYRWSASWDAMPGATSYDYQWQYGTTETGGTTNTVNGTTTQTSLTNGVNNTKPYARFRVSARNSAGNSSFSAYTSWS